MATENKSLKYFMRPVQQEIIAFTGPESFKDDDGNPINFEAKILTQQEITQINENYRRRSVATDKKGNPLVNGGELVWKTERDNARALRHIVVKSLQYPKLDDPELIFLSTPSARRATLCPEPVALEALDFYPRPPRGGRPAGRRIWHHNRKNFYPRPPRGGRPG